MKAIVRTISGTGSPFLADIAIPKATPNNVVIKMLASPINPSDDFFSRGMFGSVAAEPYVCGFEGAGIVVEAGPGVPADIVGKKVTTWPALGSLADKVGMWSQYARVPFESCVLLGDADSCEDYCEMFVNPLTILGFLDIARERGTKSFVHTAAASTLGKMLLKVCIAEGFQLICVVRRPEQVKQLQDLGAKYILNQSDPSFVEQLKEMALKLDAHLAFDAVAGDLTAALVRGLPAHSLIRTYGLLSGSQAQLGPVADLMAKNDITVKGYIVMSERVMTDPERKKQALAYLSDDIKNGGRFFKIVVCKRHKLDEFKEALASYKSIATDGKVIFTPNP